MENSSQIPSNPSEMASDPTRADDPFVDQETIALKKKRWPEIASVHIFNQDEDFETPPDDSTKNRTSVDAADPEDAVLGFFRDLGTIQKIYLQRRRFLLRGSPSLGIFSRE